MRFGAATCESFHSIDLAWLHQRGMLKSWNSTRLTWSWGGEKTGSINILVQPDGLRLRYSFTADSGEKVGIKELVPFVHTATPFGGRRQWLTCIECGWGCRKLYGGRYFRCWQCRGLKYASQSEDPAQRHASRRQDREPDARHVEGHHQGRLGVPAEAPSHALVDLSAAARSV